MILINMNKILLTILVLLIFTPNSAMASDDLTTGQQFVDKCSIVNDSLTTNKEELRFCLGFVYGMSNMMSTLSMKDLSTVYITKRFLTYLSQHKDELNQRTDLLFLSAIKDYWPL